MEIVLLRLSSTPRCRRLATAPGAQARPRPSAFSVTLFSHSLETAKCPRLQCGFPGPYSQRFRCNRFVCSPGTGIFFCQVLRYSWGKSSFSYSLRKSAFWDLLLRPYITFISLLLLFNHWIQHAYLTLILQGIFLLEAGLTTLAQSSSQTYCPHSHYWLFTPGLGFG